MFKQHSLHKLFSVCAIVLLHSAHNAHCYLAVSWCQVPEDVR